MGFLCSKSCLVMVGSSVCFLKGTVSTFYAPKRWTGVSLGLQHGWCPEVSPALSPAACSLMVLKEEAHPAATAMKAHRTLSIRYCGPAPTLQMGREGPGAGEGWRRSHSPGNWNPDPQPWVPGQECLSLLPFHTKEKAGHKHHRSPPTPSRTPWPLGDLG